MRAFLVASLIWILPAAALAQSDGLPIQPPSSTPPGVVPGGPPPGAAAVQPEPWFRLCARRAVQRKVKSGSAIFVCGCAVGAIMATSRMTRDQKLMILRSPTFKPAGATPEMTSLTRRIFRACAVRLRAVVAARRNPVNIWARYRVGWFHKVCMKRIVARTGQEKGLRFCDCWVKEVNQASDISARSKTIIVSTEPNPPVGGPPDEDKPGIRAAAKRCAPTLRSP